jgi:hypothetical protein
MNDDDKGKHGCLRGLAWGCGCLVIAVLVLITVAYLGRDLIKETDWYKSLEGAAEQAKEDLGVAMEIAQELRSRYPAEDITMGTHTSFGENGGSALSIRILNPEFPLPDGPEGEATAREIALTVASRFPRVSQLDEVIVEVHRYREGFTSQQRYPFAVASLLPELPPPMTPVADVDPAKEVEL